MFFFHDFSIFFNVIVILVKFIQFKKINGVKAKFKSSRIWGLGLQVGGLRVIALDSADVKASLLMRGPGYGASLAFLIFTFW